MPRPQRDEPLRLDRKARFQRETVVLGERRQDEARFGKCEGGADADTRAGTEGDVSEAVA